MDEISGAPIMIPSEKMENRYFIFVKDISINEWKFHDSYPDFNTKIQDEIVKLLKLGYQIKTLSPLF